MFIAVVDWTPGNRIAKYQESDTRGEAQKHVKRVRGRYPNAFTAPDPGGGFRDWLIDPLAKTLSLSPLPPESTTLPPTDVEVVTTALLDKGSLTQAEIDAARAKLSG